MLDILIKTVLACIALFGALDAQAVDIAQQGKKPEYDHSLCARASQKPQTWQPGTPDERLVQKLIQYRPDAQIDGLLSLVHEDVMWWARLGGTMDIVALARAFHESNHTVDLQLTRCNGNSAAYFFQGRPYVTDLTRGSVPPYAIASEEIPPAFKSQPLGRYGAYFERTRPLPGNDLTILVDELNAHITGARLEVALAGSPLYAEAIKSGKYQSYDGNIEGVADFMLYFLAYTKAVKHREPGAYQRIKTSPLFLAHVQRLWSAAENVLNDARPYTTENGGMYLLSRDTLDAVYSDQYISALDDLGIRHASSIRSK